MMPSIWSDEEFMARFGDTIDDRIAEILDVLLEERDSARAAMRCRRSRLRALRRRSCKTPAARSGRDRRWVPAHGEMAALQVISYPAGRPDTSRDGIGWACAGLSRLF